MTTTGTVQVDPSNAEQLRAWDGDEGAYWAQHADRFDASIASHHERFMAAASIGTGDVVLDVGCGAGQTTIDAARANGDALALGVDLSSAMLDVARRRAAAARTPNAHFLQADAQIYPFDRRTADVVLGRTSAMFFSDHGAAFANMHAALRTGGRLVLLTWQPLEHNEWLHEIATALTPEGPPRLPPPGMGPFSLSEPARVNALLSDSGFADVEFTASAAPMRFGADAGDATTFILGLMGWMLDGVDDVVRQRAIDALHDTCAGHEGPDGVTFSSGAWLVTAVAR